MPVPQPQVREHIRRRRNQLDLSLDVLAFALSSSASVLSRWERGVGPLPEPLTEADVERVLDEIERERVAS